MEESKKAAKKLFSVPCAKGKAGGTGDAVPLSKASSQARKDTDSKKGTKETAAKAKKADKSISDTTKTDKKSSSVPKKTTPRSLTDTEYQSIFRAVIEDFAGTQEDEDNVYLAPTQIDTQPEKKIVKAAPIEKPCSAHEEDSDLDPSDKENFSENENAAENDDSDAASSQAVKDTVSKGGTKETAAKAKKADKSKSDTTKTGKKSSSVPKKQTPRSLTDTEYQLIFRAVIEDFETELKKKQKEKRKEGEKGKKRSKKEITPKDSAEDRKEPLKHEEDDGEPVKKAVRKTKSKKTDNTTEHENEPVKKAVRKIKSKKPDNTTEYKNEPVKKAVRKTKSKKTDTTEQADADCEKEDESECEKDKTLPKNEGKGKVRGEEREKNGAKHEEKEGKEDAESVVSEQDEGDVGEEEREKNEAMHEEEEEEEEGKEEAESVVSEQDEGDVGEEEREKNEAMHEEEEEEEEGKEEAESVVSGQSLNSSLLDMAQAVDQWDRLEEIRELNEHTPCINEAEEKPTTVARKPKKKKHRENLLAPRKLSFDGGVLKKKRRHAQQSDSDDASSVPAELGTWVQCEDSQCQKWRYLPDIHDPIELSPRWVCSMNADEKCNSCDSPQQEYDESDHIFTRYTLGSLVWAKMDGFPWWPAMVDTDPDCDIYCLIPHEDSMEPMEYHVVYLDERVTRSWVKQCRLQPLSHIHLGPGSIFMRGHKYKKEMPVAMRRAEVALSMPLQERVNQFGFSACFRKVNSRWTKANMKKTNPLKRKAAVKVKPASSHKAMPGPTTTKKRRMTTGRRLSENDSDSDSCASHSSSSADSDHPSSSDDGGDDDSDADDHVPKRFLAKQKRKTEQRAHEGRKVLKDLSLNQKIAERKLAHRKGLGKPTSKKNWKTSVRKTQEVSCDVSVKTKGHRRERKVYTTDSESNADVSFYESGQKESAKVSKPLKKKFKSVKKLGGKFSTKENIQRKENLSNPKDRITEDGSKKGKKTTFETKMHRNVAPANKSDTATDLPKYGNSEQLHQKSSDQPPKKKKLFKSEMAKKRDKEVAKKREDSLSLQQKENRPDVEDKKPRSKSQKFVAPVKPKSEKSDSKAKRSIDADSSGDKETLDKPEAEQPAIEETNDDDTDLVLTLPQQDQPDLKSLSTLCHQSSTQSPASKQENLSLHKSPPLSPHNKDQFVPSMDDSEKDSDEDRIDFLEDVTDKKEEDRERKEEEDMDSDCLDLEEDLPIPSLQQVLKVPSKGCSDHDSVMSDPLEMAED